MFDIVCGADPVLQVDFPRHFRAHVSKTAARSRFRSSNTVRATENRWIPARFPDSLVRRSSLFGGVRAAMRPQQLIDTLNDPHASTFVIRCTSGAEYSVPGPTSWWFMRETRALMIVKDAETVVAIDPMLVESIALIARED